MRIHFDTESEIASGLSKNYLFLICTLLFFVCLTSELYSQNDTTKIQRAFLSGYIKDMQQFNFVDEPDTIYTTTELHNRLNFKWKPVKNFELNAAMRNRLFVGDFVKLNPAFADNIDDDPGYVDLSFNWVATQSMVINTTFDRLNIDWQKNKWHVRLGRQRINWGINFSWNPNDIFNSYNFLDFDYEERPGSDAVLMEYNISNFSGMSIAYEPSEEKDDGTAALRYTFNKHGYDFQLIGGNYKTDLVVGGGWAGNIKDAGFKGELSFFHPRQNFIDTTGVLSASISFDYAFKKGWYVNVSMLYNGYSKDNQQSLQLLRSPELSPKNLMPARYNFMITTSKNFNPLLSANFSVVYSPQINLLIILPYVSYSITNSFDLDLFIQSYWADNFEDKFDVVNNAIYLRLRWSF